jgi:hypothetical protein
VIASCPLRVLRDGAAQAWRHVDHGRQRLAHRRTRHDIGFRRADVFEAELEPGWPDAGPICPADPATWWSCLTDSA